MSVQVGPEYAMFGMSGSNSTAWPVFGAAFTGHSGDKSNRILAIKSNHTDARQMVQQSTFTIHGVNDKLDTSENSDKYLVKLIIPADFKNDLLKSITHFGISKSYLFPDLDNLACDIEGRHQS